MSEKESENGGKWFVRWSQDILTLQTKSGDTLHGYHGSVELYIKASSPLVKKWREYSNDDFTIEALKLEALITQEIYMYEAFDCSNGEPYWERAKARNGVDTWCDSAAIVYDEEIDCVLNGDQENTWQGFVDCNPYSAAKPAEAAGYSDLIVVIGSLRGTR